MFKQDDIDKFKEVLPSIVEAIDETKQRTYEPTYDEQMAVAKIVLDFVKRKRRKLMGGYAQNILVKNLNQKDAFYSDKIIPDVDCYSPDPVNDIYELCNILHEKGFKEVVGQEAQHKETYRIFVNYAVVFDISYVPTNVYNNIPFIEIDGMLYTHPSFIYIDLFKMITDPLFSSWRWEKVIKRLPLLLKHFPFNKMTAGLPNVYNDKPNGMVMDKIHTFLKDNTTTIVIGNYVYNCFLSESGVSDKRFKYIDIPFYQFVSINYKEDGAKLYKILKDEFGEDIKLVEHYPLWTMMGYNAYYYYKDICVAHIIHYSKRCTPIKKISDRTFKDGKIINNKGSTIQIACFDYMMMTTIVNKFDMKIKGDKDKMNYYNIMLSHLLEMRDTFLKKNKKTFFDDTIFQEFIPECVGISLDVPRDSLLRGRINMEKGRPAKFKYHPGDQQPKDWNFANTSGNKINNPSNFKILST